jgi:hypothetical protein
MEMNDVMGGIVIMIITGEKMCSGQKGVAVGTQMAFTIKTNMQKIT